MKVVVIVKDITRESPTIVELQKMLKFKEGNIKKIVNTSGLLYREMRLSEKLDQMLITEVLALLSQHGMLIKRPFLLGEHFGLTGFNEAEWAKYTSE